MINNDVMINTLILAIKNDLERGGKKEEIIKALAPIVGPDICNKIRERL